MLKTIQSTIVACKNHKIILSLLFVVQLIYLIIHFAVNVKYSIIIGQQFQDFVGLLQNANYDADLINAGTPFLNIGLFYSSYYALIASVKRLLAYELLIFLSLGIALWTGTWLLFRTTTIKDSVVLYSQLLLRALLFVVPMYALISVLLDNSLTLASGAEPWFYVVIVLWLVLFYFMMVSIALDGSFVQAVKRSFVLGIKKIPIILGTLLVIAAAVSGSGYIIYISLDMPLWILTLPILLLVCVLVIGRIFFMSIVRQA